MRNTPVSIKPRPIEEDEAEEEVFLKRLFSKRKRGSKVEKFLGILKRGSTEQRKVALSREEDSKPAPPKEAVGRSGGCPKNSRSNVHYDPDRGWRNALKGKNPGGLRGCGRTAPVNVEELRGTPR